MNHNHSIKKVAQPTSKLKKLKEYYSDILCHKFHKIQAKKYAVATTFGLIKIFEDISDTFDDFSPKLIGKAQLPEESPVVGLTWLPDLKLISSSKGKLFLYDINSKEPPSLFYENKSDITHLEYVDSKSIYFSSEDGRTKLMDLETLTILSQVQSTNDGAAEVCKVSTDVLAIGHSKGCINFYDPQMRSKEKIVKLEQKGARVTDLDITKDSTWMAVVATDSSKAPTIYNVRARQKIPIDTSKLMSDSKRIHTVLFDSFERLYWGGANGIVFRSNDLLESTSHMRTMYDDINIQHLNTLASSSIGNRYVLSAAGTSNGVLFSTNDKYWGSTLTVSNI